MTTAPVLVRATPARDHRPGTARLLLGQVRYSNSGFWRTPIAAFFTLIFPLSFLVIIASIAGNEVLDDRAGVRLAQFLAPVFAVFGVVMASFSALAISVALAREQGVLKRLRGTPLPPWVYLAGRIGSAVWISLIATVLLIGVGVGLYGVQIVWRTLPALLVTLVVGIACFAALGLAIVALAPSASAVQAITTGILIPLSFLSDIFTMSTGLPEWLSRVGWFFPLKHFANAVADDFNPYLTGSGFYAGHLLVMAVWGLAGLAVAARFLRWDPKAGARAPRVEAGRSRRRRSAGAARATGEGRPQQVTVTSSATPTARRPSAAALLRGQVRYANRGTWRDPSTVFFAVVFPVLLLVFFRLAYHGAVWSGVSLEQYTTPVFTVYGIGVAVFVNLPQAVTEARERGVLKRLRGTPLPPWVYLAGRIGSAYTLAVLIVLLTFGVGVGFLGVQLRGSAIPALLGTYLVGTACFTALGLAVAAVAESTRTVAAVTLGTLLPLSFFSGIFLIGDLPPVMSAIGWAFPLRHFAMAAFTASDPNGTDWSAWWLYLGVMVAWGLVAAGVAWRFFHWEPRPGRGKRGTSTALDTAG